jgi:trk system potassium uptake protein TrkH
VSPRRTPAPRLPDAYALASASGAYFAAAPATLSVTAWWHGAIDLEAPAWPWFVALLAATALVITGASLRSIAPHKSTARIAGLGLLGLIAVGGEPLLLAPAWVLFGLSGALLALVATRRAIRPATGLTRQMPDKTRPTALAASSASLVAIGLWLTGVLSGNIAREAGGTLGLVGLLLTGLVAVALTVRWALKASRTFRLRVLIGGVTLLLAVLAALLLPATSGRDSLESVTYVGAATLVALALLLPGRRSEEGGSFWEPILFHPDRLLATTFAGLILFGTILLALPVSSTSGLAFPIDAAAFTSVSAVCVTGLGVLDTAKDFTPFGQGVILFLIQVGGLGIMTFSTAAIHLMGRRVSLRQEGVVARIVNAEDRSRLARTTGHLIAFTLAVEALGALALTLAFAGRGMDLGDALWNGVFTSISAFCNAGFFMDGQSLVPWQAAPEILHVTGLLIICGGLSPLAVLAVPDLVRRRRVPVQARAILLVSGALLLIGFLAFGILEWDRALDDLSPWDRIHNAWFQSVTLRTAGFNSIDLAATGPVTYMFMLVLMFVGGSPGSTAGGARTTTLLVLLLAIVAAVRNRSSVNFARHAIKDVTIFKAAAIVTVMGALVFGATMALLLTQDIGLRLALFEVISAMATVGLTIGATAELDTVGRVIIMACMFIGRIGALSLLLFLAQSEQREDPVKFPTGHIQVI